MEETVVITFTGLYPWATLNGLWAIMEDEGVVPSRIHLFHISPISESARESKFLLERFLSKSKVQIFDVSISTNGMDEFRTQLEQIVAREKKFGARMILDATPGRKLFVITALNTRAWNEIDRVTYLFLDNLEGASIPYPLISMKRQKLIDIKEVAQ